MIVAHRGASVDVPAPIVLADSAEFRIGAREGARESLFTRVAGAVRLPDGTFAILDQASAEVRVFDVEGAFVRRFGGKGDGPGEFDTPSLLLMTPDETFVVWDSRTRMISQFGLDGSFLKRLNFVPGVILLAAVGRGETFLAVREVSGLLSPEGGRVLNTAQLVRATLRGERETLSTFSGTEWHALRQGRGVTILRPWYYRQALTAFTPEGVWVGDGTDWEIRRYSVTNGKLDRIVRIDRDLERFGEDWIRALHAAELQRAGTPEAREALVARQQLAEYPTMVPPIRELFADVAGRIWLARTEGPVASSPLGMGVSSREWVILEDEGEEVVGGLSFPEGPRWPLYADRDGVLAVAFDEMGVPYVEWRLILETAR
jgi:hypothetical protein